MGRILRETAFVVAILAHFPSRLLPFSTELLRGKGAPVLWVYVRDVGERVLLPRRQMRLRSRPLLRLHGSILKEKPDISEESQLLPSPMLLRS